ncbi:AtpZ/AtpI family protein [Parablautia intestinalis]|uniref:AtpZ/AtpI family protein n=1 Tax=Parablautia intestinalis TaxID=2320100 RepID=A0A3A9AGS3_9FIRM|nr:AtpZ/AtpI family protein [Parablautia intestinalis]MDE7047787.1 AtpZ/AtpI family protein [Lachnospiraceae bacterium]RKI90549.1 AtpZ/AtpI family protein [Parablautia intestinalis]
MRGERHVKFNRKVYQSLTMIGQFGINMLVPVFLCSFLGIFLDEKLGTNFLVIVLFFVGAIAGGYNVYRFARGIFASDSEQSAYLHGSRKSRGNADERKNHQDKQDSV